jgi:hypothetical protein
MRSFSALGLEGVGMLLSISFNVDRLVFFYAFLISHLLPTLHATIVLKLM